jgi:hypothetical protein
MKATLIKSEDSYILKDGLFHVLGIDDKKLKDRLECPYLLFKQNCDEIFGVVDVEKLAELEAEKRHNWDDHDDTDIYNDLIREDAELIKIGLNKAMELNKDKVFTSEDVITAIVHHTYLLHNDGKGYEDGDNNDDRIDYVIAALKQQPTEIEVMIVMECLDPNCDGVNRKGDCIPGNKPKLDSEGRLILKKI